MGQRFIFLLSKFGSDPLHLCIKLKETKDTAMLAVAFFAP